MVSAAASRGASLLFLLAVAGLFVVAVPAPAVGQAEYTGIAPPVPPADPYVGSTYAGLSPGAGAPPVVAARSPGTPPGSRAPAILSVGNAALGEAPEVVDEASHRLVTGWDLVTIGALGLTAVVAFAVSAARFRSP